MIKNNSLTPPNISQTQYFLNQTREIQNQLDEFFMVIYLNQDNKLIHKQSIKIPTGIIDIKDIFHPALIYDCYGLVLAHNHPSGQCYPSKKDLIFTKKVKKVGQILGIKIVDHLIVTKDDYFSFLCQSIL